MKKSLTKFFSLIALAGVVFFSSCGSSEDDVNLAGPSGTLTDVNTADNPSYEKGDKITYRLTASIPNGFKAGSGIRSVNGTDDPSSAFKLNINPSDTVIDVTLHAIEITENAGEEVTVSVTLIDNSDQNVVITAKYTVAATGQGGGGTVPLLRGKATVKLGDINASEGSYLASSTGTVYASADAKENQGVIDITFATIPSGNPALVSPDERANQSLNAGSPAMDAPSTTFFKAEASGPTDLGTVKAIDVENNISAATTKLVEIAEGKTYSFVQSGDTGKKGYIRVIKITGSGAPSYTRVAEIEFVVQQ